MKKSLIKIKYNIYHYDNGKLVEGCPSGLRGDLRGISGDLIGISGDLSEIGRASCRERVFRAV